MSELLIDSFIFCVNDVLNGYHLFMSILTNGLEEDSDQYAKMEEDAIRHTKAFREMIIDLSKIEEI